MLLALEDAGEHLDRYEYLTIRFRDKPSILLPLFELFLSLLNLICNFLVLIQKLFGLVILGDFD